MEVDWAWFRRNKVDNNKNTFDLLMVQLERSNDFKDLTKTFNGQELSFGFYSTLVDSDILHKEILKRITENQFLSLADILNILPLDEIEITSNLSTIQDKLLSGYVMIYKKDAPKEVLLAKASAEKTRTVSLPEVEFSVVGPKEALVESLDTNINLIRKRVPLPDLISDEVTIGDLSKTRVAVMHIEGIANKDNVQTLRQRLLDLEVDMITDSSYITQLIQDNANSPFPQLIDSERPDRLASALAEGKIYNISSKRVFDITKPMTNQDITIKINLKGIVREFSGKEINQPIIKKIQSQWEKQLEEQSKIMITDFQRNGIDPLGIGKEMKSRTRKWDEKKWKDLYPNLNIHIKVTAEILETGVIE